MFASALAASAASFSAVSGLPYRTSFFRPAAAGAFPPELMLAEPGTGFSVDVSQDGLADGAHAWAVGHHVLRGNHGRSCGAGRGGMVAISLADDSNPSLLGGSRPRQRADSTGTLPVASGWCWPSPGSRRLRVRYYPPIATLPAPASRRSPGSRPMRALILCILCTNIDSGFGARPKSARIARPCRSLERQSTDRAPSPRPSDVHPKRRRNLYSIQRLRRRSRK